MATEAEGKTKQVDLGPEVFDDYDAFLKHAIREYYDRGWKSRRGNFIGLVMASGQMTSMAAESIRDGSGLKKAALGAAGMVALRIGLRYALSGPLGIILTGAAAMSLGGYALKNRKEISAKVVACRTLIADTRTRSTPFSNASRISSARRALATAWLALVVAETIAASSGIGFLAMDAREFLRTDVIVLVIVIYAFIGVVADSLARMLERRLLAWHPNFAAEPT